MFNMYKKKVGNVLLIDGKILAQLACFFDGQVFYMIEYDQSVFLLLIAHNFLDS